ncbi:MAG: hypothetical protein JEZ12_25725 [Desulfobacterium sp.]|nr:hypothetical protein [Desulfobacterium sp.]
MGIDSQNCPMDLRVTIWNRLANEWKCDQLQDLYREVPLEDIDTEIARILRGGQQGRVVINLNKS